MGLLLSSSSLAPASAASAVGSAAASLTASAAAVGTRATPPPTPGRWQHCRQDILYSTRQNKRIRNKTARQSTTCGESRFSKIYIYLTLLEKRHSFCSFM